VPVFTWAAKLADLGAFCRKEQNLPHTDRWFHYRWCNFCGRCRELSVKVVGTLCKQPWTSVTSFKRN